MDRSIRNLSITTLLVIAVFLALNQIVRRAALGDWWQVLLFLLLALLLWAYDRFGRGAAPEVAEVEIEPIVYERHAPVLPAQTTAPPVVRHEAAPSVVTPIVEAPVPIEVPAPAAAPPAPEVKVEAAPPPPPVVEAKVEAPAPAVKAASTQPDDLKVIEGIGPKMEKALHAAGIKTFSKLAQTSEEQINAAIKAAGMRFAPSVPTWAEQAAFAARGDFAGLEAFQKSLTAGRREK